MRYLIVSSFLAVAASSQAAFVIDSFSTSQALVTRSALGAQSNSLVVGPYTRVQGLDVTGYDDQDGFARATSRISNGAWSFSSDDFVTANGTLTYNYATPADYSGITGIKLDFVRLDQSSTVSYTATSVGGGTQSGSFLVAASASPFSYVLTPTSTSGSFNPAQIASLSINLTGPESLDFRLDSIEAVPEPASLAVIGLGIAGLARRRRKA